MPNSAKRKRTVYGVFKPRTRQRPSVINGKVMGVVLMKNQPGQPVQMPRGLPGKRGASRCAPYALGVNQHVGQIQWVRASQRGTSPVLNGVVLATVAGVVRAACRPASAAPCNRSNSCCSVARHAKPQREMEMEGNRTRRQLYMENGCHNGGTQ